MASAKRRRSINVNVHIVEAVRKRGETLKMSPTSVVNAILKGEIPAILTKLKTDGGTKAVSMSEALYLALKEYAEIEYPEDPYTAVADRILRGEIPSLPEIFLETGEAKAKEREVERLAKKSAELKVEPEEKISIIKEQRNDDQKDQEKFHKQLSKGESRKKEEIRPSQDLQLDQEYYGGVKLL